MTPLPCDPRSSALPPAPDGYEYRRRVHNGDKYQTTGLFRRGAPQGTLEHLVSAPALVLDCDLANYELPNGTKDEIDARKAVLRALSQAELDTRLEPLAPRIAEVVTQICGAPPTRIVSSGYGVHVYLWLTEADSLRVAEVRSANKALMLRVNAEAGFHLADPAVHDAGTRILRIPGTSNTKNKAVPRPVVVLQSHDTTHDLERWLTVAPAKASTPAPAPAPAPAKAKAKAKAVAPAPAETAPAETADPFADAFARPAKALAWMLAEEEFFRWAQAHPEKVGRESWRGAATNIAFLLGEGGRAAFHTFSALDPKQYDAQACDQFYTDALRSAESHGPITYATLAACGDWPGPAPEGERSPAFFASRMVRPAPAPAYADPTDDAARNAMTVQLNKKNIPVNDLINITVIFRLDPNYGAHLRYNVRKNRVEWRGEPCGKKEIARAHSYLKRAYGCTFYRPWVAEAMTDIAEEHAYDPVEEYLNERALWDGAPRRKWFLNVLGAEPTPLNMAYLTCFLVGAVARALDKNKLGVQMDTALILKGPQGVGKTSIFRALGGAFHRGSRIDLNSKDRFSAVRGPWIVEWTELDETTSNAQPGSIKEFLTTMVDSYRPLYVNDEVEAPRRCVIVGTTNEDQFLRDGTGSRRFHVIETKDEVDTSLITAMRDQIWGEAVHLYRSGTKWWLTKEENELRAGASDTFQVEEVWEDRVRKYVNESSVNRRGEEKLYEITADEILTNCISKEVAHWSTKDRTRIGYILKGLGFSRTKVKGENSQYMRPRPAGNVVPLRPIYIPPEAPSPLRPIYIPPEAPSHRATPLPKE